MFISRRRNSNSSLLCRASRRAESSRVIYLAMELSMVILWLWTVDADGGVRGEERAEAESSDRCLLAVSRPRDGARSEERRLCLLADC